MRPRKLFILGIVFVLLLSMVGSASADFKKGKVSGNQFSTAEGISFLVPPTFSLSAQQNKKDGFFRIILGGPTDAKGFGPAIVIDILPSKKLVDDYSAKQLMQDIVKYPIAASVDKYTEACVIGDKLFDDHGTMTRENLVVFRLNRFSEGRVAFSYSFCYSTGKNFVRASYLCFGAQRTLTEDIPAFMDLYNSLIVP